MNTGMIDEREQRQERALAACLQAVESGKATDLCAALAEHAEFASDVAEFFSACGEVENVTAPLRSLMPLATPVFAIDSGQTAPYPDGGQAVPPEGEHADFGDYELHEVLGSGGTGVVYRAFQRSLGVNVALKMIRAGRFASPEDVARFHEDARKAAQLHHPNVVRVLTCAEYDGRHYFTMEWMQGGSLSRQIERGPVAAGRAGRWILEISQATQAAHQIGMVHRDLKPANVVLDSHDTAYVTDFGLAKWLNQESSFTATGVIVGTLGYMAPEQADGKSTVAGDIYGIGAILYALLTGRPPFQSETGLGTLEQVRNQEPIAPHLLNPEADPDLELICLKCLEKEPERRYPSATAVAEDLQAFLAGEPLHHARRRGLTGVLFKPFEHHLRGDLLRSWSQSNSMSAAIGFLGHGAVFALIQTGQPVEFALLVLGCLWILMAMNIWVLLIRNARSAHRTEGHILATYLGYVLAYPILFTSPGMGNATALLAAYPVLAVLTGLVVFVHGSLFWGRQYLVGLAYYGLAFLMRLWPALAPLEFAIFHSSYLIFMSRHMRRHQH
jgi:serine/threonine protein kinase